MSETKEAKEIKYQWIKVLDFSPTQLPVGLTEVLKKEEKLRSKKPDKQRKWLMGKPVPYVMFRGKYFPTDHHHLIRAAWQANIAEVYGFNIAETENFDSKTKVLLSKI